MEPGLLRVPAFFLKRINERDAFRAQRNKALFPPHKGEGRRATRRHGNYCALPSRHKTRTSTATAPFGRTISGLISMSAMLPR